uniref:Iris n=1 Tax=Drosophila mauritiana TaxID=7226 RepID=Q30CM2_DROMA|nr:Iris [Drosophila mauritiana]ABA60867.1 Iris [Drosophila mauritiana]
MKAIGLGFILVTLRVALSHGSPVGREAIGGPMAMRGFNNSLGTFVEYSGQASLASKDWELCASFNLESLYLAIIAFNSVYKDVVDKCERQSNSCPEIMNITKFADSILHDGLMDLENALYWMAGRRSSAEDDVGNELRMGTSCIDSSINVINVSLQEPVQDMMKPRLYFMGNRLKSAQNAITEAIISAHQGKLSPLVLSIKQLQAKMPPILGDLSRSGIRNVYLLASVVPRQRGNQWEFQITVPLLDAEKFNIYRLTPIPRLNNGVIQLVETETPYLGINDHLDRYFPLQNLDDCIKLGAERFVCRHNHIIYGTGDDSFDCSLAAIRNQSSAVCTLRQVEEKSLWTQMVAPNSWMVALTKELTLIGVCSGERQELHINGSGILSIQSDCAVRSPAVTLHGQPRKTVPSKRGYAALQQDSKSSRESVSLESFNQLLAIVGQLELNQKKPEAVRDFPMVVIAVCPAILLVALLASATWLYRTHRSKQLAQAQSPVNEVNGLQEPQNRPKTCNLPLLEKQET